MAKRPARPVVALAAVKNLGDACAPRVLDPITTSYPQRGPIVKVNSNDQQ
jgi:hypothetical protein